MNSSFKLFLFCTDPEFIGQAIAAGIDGIVVDWENIDKYTRQQYADTQINDNTLDDLCRVRASTAAHIICRLNGFGATTIREIEEAIAGGADEILLPMVRTVGEVETVLDQVHSRCKVGILIETVEAVQLAPELSRLPISRAYVGLNDLAIQRQSPSIFTALVDNLVDQVRRAVDVPFGFGGLTLPDRGYPIPCRLLIGEMARLDCNFSFLRRSFYRDIVNRQMAVEIPRLRQAIQQAQTRDGLAIALDRLALQKSIQAWPEVPKMALGV